MYTSDFEEPWFFCKKLRENLASINVQKSNLEAMYMGMHRISFTIPRWMFKWWQTQHLSELVQFNLLLFSPINLSYCDNIVSFWDCGKIHKRYVSIVIQWHLQLHQCKLACVFFVLELSKSCSWFNVDLLE